MAQLPCSLSLADGRWSGAGPTRRDRQDDGRTETEPYPWDTPLTDEEVPTTESRLVPVRQALPLNP
jgi:hypothetical protein